MKAGRGRAGRSRMWPGRGHARHGPAAWTGASDLTAAGDLAAPETSVGLDLAAREQIGVENEVGSGWRLGFGGRMNWRAGGNLGETSEGDGVGGVKFC